MPSPPSERFNEILAELRRERDTIQPQLEALNDAIQAFERLHRGGRKARGRPKGSGRKGPEEELRAS